MKFTFPKTKYVSPPILCAYINKHGDLMILNRDHAGGDCVCLTVYGSVITDMMWEPEEAVTSFFEGDTVTIQF